DRMIGVTPPAYDPAAPTTAHTLPVGAPATVRPFGPVGRAVRTGDTARWDDAPPAPHRPAAVRSEEVPLCACPEAWPQ
ncbi:hypothetical protein, partial [Streptomyces longwoodensis]